MIPFRAFAFGFGLALSALPVAARADTMPMAQTVHLGPLVLSGAFIRATLPGAPVGGGFITIENTGKIDDRLIGASSPVAGHTEVHEMKMDGGVMKMRALKDGLPIPAGKTVILAPGGYHLMFMKLKEPLKQGTMVSVKLKFEKAGSVEVKTPVAAPNAKMPGMGDMKKMDMGKTSGALEPAPALQGTRLPDAG